MADISTGSSLRKLNLGSGPVQPAGWENVDGSLRAFVASRLPFIDKLMVSLNVWPVTEFNTNTVFANLMKRLPWPDASVHCIYMGEVLEHFTREQGETLLRECFRLLAPGGTLRIRVPDNARFWRNYLRDFDAVQTGGRAHWTDAHSRWVEMFFHDICVKRTTFVSYGHYHKWMYDEISLILALERVGFVRAERKPFLDSAIPDVKAVEVRDDLIVEARRP